MTFVSRSFWRVCGTAAACAIALDPQDVGAGIFPAQHGCVAVVRLSVFCGWSCDLRNVWPPMVLRPECRPRYGSPMSGALVVGICGVVLASLSLGWQAASYVLSGGRIKVRLLVGAVGNGAMVTGPVDSMTPGWFEGLAAQGFSQPIVAVSVANVGRQPVKVARWGLESGLGMSLHPSANGIGPSLPHRLDVGDAATWAVEMATVRVFFEIANEVSVKSPGDAVNRRTLFNLGTLINRPRRTEVVATVDLADGRPKRSSGALRQLGARHSLPPTGLPAHR